MKRSTLLYLVDMGLAISFFFVFATGVIKLPNFAQKLGISQMSLPMFEINFIHDWSGLIMGLLVLLHLVFHWKWLVAMTRSLVKR